MDLGSESLAKANLIIPQKTSLEFYIVHTDEDGQVIDHSESVAHMAIQTRDGETTYQLDSCCTCSTDKITVFITPADSAALPVDAKGLKWDMMVHMADGEVIRLVAGNVSVVDTYACDAEG